MAAVWTVPLLADYGRFPVEIHTLLADVFPVGIDRTAQCYAGAFGVGLRILGNRCLRDFD